MKIRKLIGFAFAAGTWVPLVLVGGEPRDFIEFLPSCKRHYVDNDKLNARTWERAWTIRDERFNDVTNLFLDIEHPETFPRELFDSATSAGVRPFAARFTPPSVYGIISGKGTGWITW